MELITKIENFLSEGECKLLIDMIDAKHQRSGVVSAGEDRATISDVRTSSTSYLYHDNDVVLKNIFEKIANHLGFDPKQGEYLQGQLYEPGQFFKPHTDFFDPSAYHNHCLQSGNRIHTFMVYLNENMEGGTTNFPSLNLTITPKTGMAVSWPNMKDGEVIPEVLHEGSEVTSGKKYIITSWWRERNIIPGEDTRLAIEYHKNLAAKTEGKKTFSTVEEIPRFTETGFKVVKCPPETWALIREAYELLKSSKVEETFPGKETVILGEGNTSDLMSFDKLPTIRQMIHNQLQPLHEEFSKANIKPAFIYGIRSYNKGAKLATHVDRIETHHISSIIIVDKDLECGCTETKATYNDWALDIQDHKGQWHKIYAEIGDIILYESAVCQHGRLDPFKGNWYRNFFVHYTLEDYIYDRK